MRKYCFILCILVIIQNCLYGQDIEDSLNLSYLPTPNEVKAQKIKAIVNAPLSGRGTDTIFYNLQTGLIEKRIFYENSRNINEKIKSTFLRYKKEQNHYTGITLDSTLEINYNWRLNEDGVFYLRDSEVVSTQYDIKRREIKKYGCWTHQYIDTGHVTLKTTKNICWKKGETVSWEGEKLSPDKFDTTMFSFDEKKRLIKIGNYRNAKENYRTFYYGNDTVVINEIPHKWKFVYIYSNGKLVKDVFTSQVDRDGMKGENGVVTYEASYFYKKGLINRIIRKDNAYFKNKEESVVEVIK